MIPHEHAVMQSMTPAELVEHVLLAHPERSADPKAILDEHLADHLRAERESRALAGLPTKDVEVVVPRITTDSDAAVPVRVESVIDPSPVDPREESPEVAEPLLHTLAAVDKRRVGYFMLLCVRDSLTRVVTVMEDSAFNSEEKLRVLRLLNDLNELLAEQR